MSLSTVGNGMVGSHSGRSLFLSPMGGTNDIVCQRAVLAFLADSQLPTIFPLQLRAGAELRLMQKRVITFEEEIIDAFLGGIVTEP